MLDIYPHVKDKYATHDSLIGHGLTQISTDTFNAAHFILVRCAEPKAKRTADQPAASRRQQAVCSTYFTSSRVVPLRRI
jgi:hypothetical protein